MEEKYAQDTDKAVLTKTRKRKSFGRMSEVAKELRLQSQTTGPDWCCKRLKCFEKVDAGLRQEIISQFNMMASYDEQNCYLVGLIITVLPVERRRPRQDVTGRSAVPQL